MINAKIYCLCLENSLLSKVKSINYIPVGLGSGKFSDEWLRDNNGNNTGPTPFDPYVCDFIYVNNIYGVK